MYPFIKSTKQKLRQVNEFMYISKMPSTKKAREQRRIYWGNRVEVIFYQPLDFSWSRESTEDNSSKIIKVHNLQINIRVFNESMEFSKQKATIFLSTQDMPYQAWWESDREFKTRLHAYKRSVVRKINAEAADLKRGATYIDPAKE